MKKIKKKRKNNKTKKKVKFMLDNTISNNLLSKNVSSQNKTKKTI